MKPRVLHVISGLGIGGAEMSLLQLVRGLGEQFDFHVASLTAGGGLEQRFRELGVPVSCLPLARHPLSWWRLRRLALDYQPDLLHGWMYHGNLLSSSIRPDAATPVVWSVRHNAESLNRERAATRLVIRVGGMRFWQPDRVVYNSQAAAASHASIGYGRYPSCVITNGVDAIRFQASREHRQRLRAELGCGEDVLLVGYVGRGHPDKDLPTLFATFERLRGLLPRIRFVAVGAGLAGPQRPSWVDFLGVRDDPACVYPALDLLVLSSREESTPNVLLEAMACEVPVVSTRTGDVEQMIGEESLLAPVADASALANAALGVLRQNGCARAELGARLRQRVVAGYTLADCLDEYANLYRQLGSCA